MKLALVLCALLAPAWPVPPASAMAAADLPRGVIVESVRTEADAGQTYALYLPANYTPAKRWPTLYAFDPAGRGHLPVELFRAAAERYGYIVVGSNNSRNGLPVPSIAQIINTLWRDTHARLSINDERVYATGFSGGARVANRLAVSCKSCIAGVISCGAGFPPDLTPDASVSYAFFGTVGWDDFNFREMRPLARTLDALGVVNRLATFDGRHQWCPEEICAEGIEWMELLAMKRGRESRDDALIDGALARLTARSESLKRPDAASERYVALMHIATTFDGLRDVARFRDEAAALKNTKEFRAAISGEERQIAEEQKRAKDIVGAAGALLDASAHDAALARLKGDLASLRDKSQSATDGAERRVARRTLSHVYAESLESALYLYTPQQNYKLAAANLELAAAVFPAIAQTEYELARVLALDGRKEEAFAALDRAVGKGFRDDAAIAREEAFAALRAGKKYEQLLARMRAGGVAK